MNNNDLIFKFIGSGTYKLNFSVPAKSGTLEKNVKLVVKDKTNAKIQLINRTLFVNQNIAVNQIFKSDDLSNLQFKSNYFVIENQIITPQHETNNAVIYRAMRKYGAGIFHIEQIEECENSKLDEREKYWIEYYDSYKNGYNSTPGGTALPSGKMFARLDDDLLHQLWDKGYSISEIVEKTGYSDTSIREHLHEYDKFSIEESISRGINKAAKTRSQEVSQWDLQGNFIQTY